MSKINDFSLKETVRILKENNVSLEELVKAFVFCETDKTVNFSLNFTKKEKKAWKKVLGVEVEVLPLPAGVTPKSIRRLKSLGWEWIYFPKLDLGTLAELKELGVEKFFKVLELRYPNWHRYESLTDSQENDHSVSRNLDEWYWEMVRIGKIPFPQLTGRWRLMETMLKPMFGDKYSSSEKMKTLLGLENRFNVSYIDANKAINSAKEKILAAIGLPGGDLGLLSAIELNLFFNRYVLGKTDTYEWTNTEYSFDGASRHVFVGRSGHGGAARASWLRPEVSLDNLGFRLAASLK